MRALLILFLGCVTKATNAQLDFYSDVYDGMNEMDDYDLNLTEGEAYAMAIICTTILTVVMGSYFIMKSIDFCRNDNDW